MVAVKYLPYYQSNCNLLQLDKSVFIIAMHSDRRLLCSYLIIYIVFTKLLLFWLYVWIVLIIIPVACFGNYVYHYLITELATEVNLQEANSLLFASKWMLLLQNKFKNMSWTWKKPLTWKRIRLHSFYL